MSAGASPFAGARRVVYEGAEVAADFGDVAAEYRALDGGAGLVDAAWRRFFTATGDERLEFLHGQTTNRTKNLAAGVGCPALTLTAQGRPLAAFAVYEDGDRVWIATTAAHGDATRAALSRFLVADDCDFEAEVDAPALTVAGPRAAAVLAEAGADVATTMGNWAVATARLGDTGVHLFSRADLRVPCFDVLLVDEQGDAGDLADVWEVLLSAGGQPCGADAFEILRVESGTARYGVDVDERRIAVEARLEWAIHFDKGCYVGQEVIERAVSRGRVNHEMSMLSVPDGVEVGAHVVGGADADMVTSVVSSPRFGRIALAYLPTAKAAPGSTVALEDAQGPRGDATVLDWPRPRVLAGRSPGVTG